MKYFFHTQFHVTAPQETYFNSVESLCYVPTNQITENVIIFIDMIMKKKLENQ